MLLRGNN
jgi:hypothetical protein